MNEQSMIISDNTDWIESERRNNIAVALGPRKIVGTEVLAEVLA